VYRRASSFLIFPTLPKRTDKDTAKSIGVFSEVKPVGRLRSGDSRNARTRRPQRFEETVDEKT